MSKKDRQLQPLNLSDYISKRDNSRAIEVYRKQQESWDAETVEAEIIDFVPAGEHKQTEPSVVNTQNIHTQNIHYHYHGSKKPTQKPKAPPPKISEGDALLWFFSLVGSAFLVGLLLSVILSGH